MSKKITVTLGFPGQTRQQELEIPDNEPATWDANAKLRLVGGDHPRKEGPDKVTGRAKYTQDVNLPGMLHGKILRSPHAHARIKNVDLAPALAIPGVKAARKVARQDVANFEGFEIAAVAATTPEIADDAVRAIRVEYEILPHVVDLEEARKPEAPKVHGERPNETAPRAGGRGDVDAGFSQAEVTVEGTFRTQVQTHVSLETHGTVCSWDGDQLTCYASTQGIFTVREELAGRLGIDQSQVRVICEHMGGGFGSKFGARDEGVICAELAREAKAPVKLMLDRKEEHLATGNRPSSVQLVKIGAKKDGSLTAIHLKAYGADGLGGGANCGAPYNRIYRCANVKTEESDVHIHAGRVAAMRAPGHPQGSFGLEQALDMVAEKIGMDPLELRKKNDGNPIRLAQYALGAERIGWSRRNPKAGADPGPRKRGFGMGSSVWGGAGGPGPQVELRVHRDGRVEVLNGSQDLGTGTRSMMAIVAAEELGLPYADVTGILGDTKLGFCGGSGGSQTAASLAPAVRNAAYEARLRLAALAAPLVGAKVEEIEFADGRARVASDPGRGIAFRELCSKIDGASLVVHADRSPNYGSFANGAAGAQFAEVEVDVETGEIHVVKIVAVHDCGRVVNKMAVESQINGGVIQGLSYALLEDRILDRPTGRMVNPNMEDYKILGALETPEIEPIAFSVANGMNSVGLLGIGEAPVIPTAAAVANAVANATGARVYELPMTPDRVLAALARGPVGNPQ